jgi:hypothetical protein
MINYKAVEARSPEIDSWRPGAIEGIGLLGLAAPVLYAKGYQIMYMASSDTWDLEYPAVDIPYIDDNLKFSQTRLKHHLFSLSRMQKVEWLSQELKKYGKDGERIKGCDDRAKHNCCRCDRCFQTLGMLFLAGQNAKLYDYHIVRENALAALKAFALKDSLDFDVLYNFVCMKDFIQRQQQAGKEVAEDLLWLAAIPFDLAKANDIDGVQKIDWKKAGKREQGVPYTAHVSVTK